MKLEGSINVWTDCDGKVSIYSTDPREEAALGYKMGARTASVLFELTAIRIRESEVRP